MALIILLAIFLASLASTVATDMVTDRRRCATVFREELGAKNESLFKSLTNSDEIAVFTLPFKPIEVSVHVHIVAKNDTPAGGNIPKQQINDQFNVLNRAFGPFGITFNLDSVEITINPQWFSNVGPHTPWEKDMKNALRTGGCGDLNVYTVGLDLAPLASITGWSSYPWACTNEPDDDGVVIQYETVPDGGREHYNMGQTLTHEVGHWMGLFHTFEGGCIGDGDHVDDTPPQAMETIGCPQTKLSCPNSNHPYSIHNFMDSSYDACMTDFTSGQGERMRRQLAMYRSI